MMKTNEQFINELYSINRNIKVVGQYAGATEQIKVECLQCGKIWEPKAYSLLQGKSCPHCSAVRGAKNNKGKTGLKTQEVFEDDLRKVNNSIEIIEKYENTHTSIKCKCNICGHIWKAMPYSLLQGHGCPRCAKSGTSFMEQFIKLCFEFAVGKDNVISRNKSAIGMELDIYIPSMNVAIEPGNWNLHKKSFKRDVEKRNKCENKGIKLFTIYDKFPKGERIPFDENCFVFQDDLNKANHIIIQGLVNELFSILDIDCFITEENFLKIEDKAYKSAKAKTHIDFVNEVKILHPNINVVGTYKNANIKLQVRCTECGNIWNAMPSGLLSGDGCKKCGTKRAHEKVLKNQDVFVEEVKKANPYIEVIGKYTGRHNTVLARCRICGCVWEPRASSLLRDSNHKGWKTIHKNIEC